MATKWKIEKIVSIVGQGQFIFIRPAISGQEIVITEKTYLGNVELDQYLDIPRKLNENGDLDLELYSVKLKNDHEVFRLKENTIVDLIQVSNHV